MGGEGEEGEEVAEGGILPMLTPFSPNIPVVFIVGCLSGHWTSSLVCSAISIIVWYCIACLLCSQSSQDASCAEKTRMPGRIKDLYKSMTSSLGGSWSNSGGTGLGYSPIKYYCMNCRYEHKENACPKCGSKAVRVR